MVLHDASRTQAMDSDTGIVEVKTYKQMDWKELGEHPLSTLTRIFGQDYLMSNIGSRPDQDTFIELDQIHNFSHLMIEYALANRIVGPLDQVESVIPTSQFPKDLVMDIQKPPDRLKNILSNLNANQSSIDYEETTLASIIAKHSYKLKPYDLVQDQLERTLKQSSPDERIGIARQDLPPTLVEQIVANIYKGRHALGSQVDISTNLDQAIGISWELVNKRIAELHVLSPNTLREDRIKFDKGLIAKYRKEHADYQAELVNSGVLRRQRNSERQEADERRERELLQIEQTKTEQTEAYEKGIELRAGLLLPNEPATDRRTALYKKSILAAQTLILTEFILNTDLKLADELFGAFDRSINPKPIEFIGQKVPHKNSMESGDEPLEPGLQVSWRRKTLAAELYKLIISRSPKSQLLLGEFLEAASLEYGKIMDSEYEQNDKTRELEATINTKLTLDQLRGEDLSKVEIEAKILLDY